MMRNMIFRVERRVRGLTQVEIIKLQDLSWRRNEQDILKRINWQVRPGEHWAILGLNGSGKTSLLKMLTGYEWPSTGSVQVLGHTYGACEIQEIRKSIGWVSSAIREELYPNDTALQVVISGKYASIGLWRQAEAADRERAWKILENMGYEELADKKFGSLSQGEKQKILLARALMATPQLLILDEPCFGLDIQAREQVLSSIQTMGSLANGPAILFVTHHIEEIQPVFTHILLLREGEIVAAGNKREVLTDLNVSRTFGVQATLDWQEERPWIRIIGSIR